MMQWFTLEQILILFKFFNIYFGKKGLRFRLPESIPSVQVHMIQLLQHIYV